MLLIKPNKKTEKLSIECGEIFIGCQHCCGFYGSEASIAISFIATPGKARSIAWISYGRLDFSVILLNQVVQLAVFRRGMIYCCGYALAKLH